MEDTRPTSCYGVVIHPDSFKDWMMLPFSDLSKSHRRTVSRLYDKEKVGERPSLKTHLLLPDSVPPPSAYAGPPLTKRKDTNTIRRGQDYTERVEQVRKAEAACNSNNTSANFSHLEDDAEHDDPDRADRDFAKWLFEDHLPSLPIPRRGPPPNSSRSMQSHTSVLRDNTNNNSRADSITSNRGPATVHATNTYQAQGFRPVNRVSPEAEPPAVVQASTRPAGVQRVRPRYKTTNGVSQPRPIKRKASEELPIRSPSILERTASPAAVAPVPETGAKTLNNIISAKVGPVMAGGRSRVYVDEDGEAYVIRSRHVVMKDTSELFKIQGNDAGFYFFEKNNGFAYFLDENVQL